MRKITILCVFFALTNIISGCDERSKEVKEFPKDGSIETVMNVDHLNDKQDIIITTHTVWLKNTVSKKIIYRDTIQALGITSQEVENSDGDKKSVSLRKEYEIYITVK
jgi:hypothetical protein